MDDNLIFVDQRNFCRTVVDVLKLFREQEQDFNFPFEVPEKDVLHFLDFRLTLRGITCTGDISRELLSPFLIIGLAIQNLLSTGLLHT